MTAAPLLQVDNLSTRFFTSRGVVSAVENVSFQVGPGEAVGIVGESGSGKSMAALSVLRLVPVPGRVVHGRIGLGERNLLDLSDDDMRQVRRRDIAMVFQDASTFLNPIMRVGDQIAEAIAEPGMPAAELRAKVIEALRQVRVPDPERVADAYPMQISGGMQQRAVIAAAIIRRPTLVIADEPTTALDATVQYQILKLLLELREKTGMSLVLISHDLAVVSGVCSRVYVMYAGQIVESGPTATLYSHPAHPYTKALLAAVLDPQKDAERLEVLAGSLPDPTAPPSGCRFHPRCPQAMARCSREEPPDYQIAEGKSVKCWLYEPAARA
jgi:oligopeptide/dipeptide ABC transporter ATP-binding protein